MTETVSLSRDIAAPPERVWTLVSDLPRMGEWSPENTGGTWLKGATGPATGARFRGTNAHEKKSWTTNITVDTCEPGREFSFEVTAGGMKVARWSYRIEATATGSRVTETWTDRRGPIARAIGKPVSGTTHDAEQTRSGIEVTLERLAHAAESGA
jgi:uncharacterized protein YndB with AHSA1/START domain